MENESVKLLSAINTSKNFFYGRNGQAATELLKCFEVSHRKNLEAFQNAGNRQWNRPIKFLSSAGKFLGEVLSAATFALCRAQRSEHGNVQTAGW